MAQQCIFCRIGKGEIPSTFLHRDDRCFVIRDLHPMAPVHLLVIPQRHVTVLMGSSEEDEALLGHLVAVAGEAAKKEGVAESGYRLIVNQGEHAGQEVAHLHVHVLGGRRLKAMA
ncbi:MAG: histidine triad nucleotide-binding protein [Dehalococcoidia bacterium]|nr:histidine triad nucleotide-binding protein [Dehalococcoidia bacterium]